MSEEIKQLPVLALRGITVFPGMLIHFDISRDITIKAVENAMLDDQIVFLAAQKDSEVNEPTMDDLHRFGCIARIKQMMRLSGNILRVLVTGIERGELRSMVSNEPFLLGEIVTYTDESLNDITQLQKNAMIRSMKELLEIYSIENSKIGKDTIKQLNSITEIEEFIDQIAINIPFDGEAKLAILEANNALERYHKITVLIAEEIEVIRLKKEFQKKVQQKVDKNQKEYILREQLKVIREELGESNTMSDAEGYLEQVDKLKATKQVKDHIKKEIERFKSIGSNSSESAVSRSYIETLLTLPWDKVSKDSIDIKKAEKVLNEEHYGMEKVKERILEFLSVRALTKKGDSPIICLVGPPGTGKTSIARSVAKSLNKKYVRISLGGVRDEAEIRGHRRTYVGAMPGRLITSLKTAGVKNPLILLDEIDKVSSDYKGDTSAALLEVLDSEQNNHFIDHYIEVPVDLSEVLFIATANSLSTIPRPLLDRMEIIEVSSYTENEKVHIALEHLIKKQLQKNGIKEKQLTFSNKAISKIITGYTKEAGVRSLERRFGEISRKSAREILEDEKKAIKITDKNVEKYLGKVKYTFDMANEADEVGIVRGLAWTSVGGDTLQIEVNVMPGKGIFELTGQIGDVMKESARAGISYIRSVSEEYQIEGDFFEKHDIHIHIPEGAVPKDGPSAGITMATAILSAITKTKVRKDIAMTGEITLRGKVLPIGGLKEKILAAKMAKINLVLVPDKNKKDIEELSSEILDGIKVQFVDSMKQVISYAFV